MPSNTNFSRASAAHLTAAERRAMRRALDAGDLASGQAVRELERCGADMLGGMVEAVATNTGTAALLAATVACGVGPGTAVLTSPFTFVATANAILWAGGIPVFVDVDGNTGNLDAAMASQAAADLSAGGTRARRWLPPMTTGHQHLAAVMPVHIFGRPADMEPIVAAASNVGALVIEDACEALGARYRNEAVGTIGDVGAFAFSSGKQVFAGQGGLIVTRRHDLARIARAVRNQGREWSEGVLAQRFRGLNLQMDELSAAVAIGQMQRLLRLLRRRAALARRYTTNLAGIAGIALPRDDANTTRPAWYTFPIRTAGELDRNRLHSHLAGLGVPSKLYFQPVHLQPYYAEAFGYQRGMFPTAEYLGSRSLSLPLVPAMLDSDVDRICEAIAGFLSQAS